MYDNEILYSILIPVYNAEKNIRTCVEAVLAQRYSKWEMILVNDGSTDKSGKLCDEFAAKDSRIHTYHKLNKGPFATRLFALEKATGDYCIYLDADDMWKDDTLTTINEYLIKYKPDCLIFGYDYYIENQYRGSISSNSLEVYEEQNKKELLLKLLSDVKYNPMWRKVFLRNLGKTKGYDAFFDLRTGEDLIQSLDIYLACSKVIIIPEKLYKYICNTSSLTATTKYTSKKDYDFFFMSHEFLFRDISDYYSADFQLFKELSRSTLKSLLSKINRTALSRIKYKDKSELYDVVINNELYKKISCEIINPKIYLFNRRHYRTVILFCKIENSLRNFRNCILNKK